jgi:hypothetical protein
MGLKDLAARTSEHAWRQMATSYAGEVQFDDGTLALISYQKNACSDRCLAEEVLPPAEEMLSRLRLTVAEDTIRNEYDLHRRLHQWLANTNTTREVEELNDRVYSELFLTPRHDPWIGLVTGDVYTALENDGISP